MSKIRPDAKATILKSLYQVATYRKLFIGALTLIALLVTFLMLYLFREKLSSMMLFLGAGTSIVVFGVVMVFSNINDTYYDIASSMFPEDFPDD